MWSFSLNELADIVLITLLASALVYVFWLRSKMSKSNASFALSIVAAMTAGSAAYVKFVSGPEVPAWANILNSTLEKTGVVHPVASTSTPAALPVINWIAEILTFGLYIVLLVCIYKIGKSTIENWEGPVTVTVNELAKNDLDKDIRALALAEFRRLVRRRRDPHASEVAVNWRQKFSNPPPTLPWHEFARQIFTVAISEALIPDNGWRDRWHVWVGQIYVSRQSPTDLVPLLLFVFDKEPTVAALDAKVRAYSEDGATVEGSKIFAVYESTAETVPQLESGVGTGSKSSRSDISLKTD